MIRSAASLVFHALLFAAIYQALWCTAVTSLCEESRGPDKGNKTCRLVRGMSSCSSNESTVFLSLSLSLSAAHLQLELTHFSSCFPLKTQTWIFHLKKQNTAAH